MTTNEKKQTRKEWERAQYEEDFYARWAIYFPKMSYQELDMLREKLIEVNSSYPETMLWLKSMVLQKMSEMELYDN